MKIKIGFVTNSSSVSYIIVNTSKKPFDIISHFKKHDISMSLIDDHEEFAPDEMKKLEIYHNGESFDWIESCTGPKKSWGRMGSHDMFYEAKKQLLLGNIVIYLDITRSDSIARSLSKIASILKIVKTEAD